LLLAPLAALNGAQSATGSAKPALVYDLVVYGDSAAAVTAAIQARRLGLNVVRVNSTRFLGGMTCSGLSAGDINNRSAVGGIALELYQRIGRHYGKAYVDYFEPQVAQAQVNALVAEAKVPVEMNDPLDRQAGVKKDGQRITSITTHSGMTYCARIFLDTSYTGDLMAAAGVSYTVGREANAQYGETINGVQRGDTRPRKHYTQRDKVDWNSMHAVGTDHVGANWDYPEADYETRRRIEKDHERYIRGHLWKLANHPRVPKAIRKEVARYGFCKDEFTDNGGWPPMIYIREARRMVSDYVVTEIDCKAKRIVPDPIALASFGMDSHAVRYFVTEEGFAERDGVIWQVPPHPYGISYRSIVPRAGECENILVPGCLSATHVAHGSIRMEPVYMQLGQAAAIAASIGIEEGVAVQEVAYSKLREKLEASGLPVIWKPKQ
jgi:hypothetical protein